MKVAKEQRNAQKNLVSLYWDWQNVRVSSHQAKCLLNFASVQGDLYIKKVYAYWRRENQRIEEALYNLSFDCLNIPSFTKNSVDRKLIADCKLEVLNNSAINIVILISGDGDFASLVRELKGKDKKVIIFAQTQASKKLISLANKSYSVSQIPFSEQVA